MRPTLKPLIVTTSSTSSRGVADSQSHDEDTITTQEQGNETRSNVAARMDASSEVAVDGDLQVEEHEIQPKATHHLVLPASRLLDTGKTATLAPGDNTARQNKSGDTAKAPDRASVIAKSIVTAPFFNPFTDLRKNADKKVVGLDYGISKSFKHIREHEWISSDSVSHPNVVSTNCNERRGQDGIPDVIPLPSLDQKEYPQGLTNQDVSKISETTNPAKNGYTQTGSPSTTKRKTVEELEFKARQKAIMNPFLLLFSGNVAALKVMGFYLITFETFLTCGLVS
jgi:hypothetical protein